MIPNLQPGTTYAVHLRAATPTGSKDWVGSITNKGEIHSYWGKTGCINQHAAKPGDSKALDSIVALKMRGKNKYALVDEYNPQQGWQSQIIQTLHPKPPEPKKQQPPLESVFDGLQAPDTSINYDF